ncbi:MAG: adenine deaminase [Acidobacteria bacterium]|nr:adenine deaminase [Acidobacteriota bacterium]
MKTRPGDGENSEAGAVQERIRLTAVARGEAPADRFIRGATVVNVYSGELLRGNVAISQGRIAYVGASTQAVGPATEVIDAAGRYLAPGWIEPHSHPWVLYNPATLLEGVLPAGTTLTFNDNLFFYLQGGAGGFLKTVEALAPLPGRCRWLVRLISQSQWAGEGADFAPEKVLPLLSRPEVAGTAEVTRWPMIFQGDERLLAEIRCCEALGKRADGHTAGASGEKLNAVVAAGITACHEAISEGEVLDRLRLGLWTVLRNSSLRPDLPELARAITQRRVDTRRLMLTADGPAPRFIAERGFIDEALRRAVAAGVSPVAAIQMATLNPATYYRVDHEVGGVAPGRLADLLILPDLESFRPERVMVAGRDVARMGRLAAELPVIDWDSLGMRPEFAPAQSFAGERLYRPWDAGEQLPVIEFVSNVITRPGGLAEWGPDGSVPQDLILAMLLDRRAQWAGRCWVRGFAPRLAGLASTFNTTTHLLVMGADTRAMRRAAARVAVDSGGIAVTDSGGAARNFPLPIAGMMSPAPFAAAVQAQRELEAHVQFAGFPYDDILYALLFLTCDFLPGWRLTPRGVLDVKKGELIRPAESLPLC